MALEDEGSNCFSGSESEHETFCGEAANSLAGFARALRRIFRVREETSLSFLEGGGGRFLAFRFCMIFFDGQ